MKGKFCTVCKSSKKLELDHKNPGEKIDHKIWSWSKKRQEVELAKCQVLCATCHKDKSKGEKARGERNGHAKLDWGKVHRIRTRGENAAALAEELGVNRSQIFKVRRGDTWKPQ